jgi:hypothetical protein
MAVHDVYVQQVCAGVFDFANVLSKRCEIADKIEGAIRMVTGYVRRISDLPTCIRPAVSLITTPGSMPGYAGN